MNELELNNPFMYDQPVVDPAHFFGREVEARTVFSRLWNMESSAIVGAKHIGKTSFLRYLSYPGMSKNFGIPEKYLFVYIDLEQNGKQVTPIYFWRTVLHKINDAVREQMQPQRNQYEQLGEDHILGILPEKNPLSDPFYTERLGILFDTIGRAGYRVVLLLDGFDSVTKNTNFDMIFFGNLRSLAIHHNLALITSSYLELVELCYSEAVAGSPFFNIFANIDLSLFTKEEADQLIDQSLATGGQVTFLPGEREFLIHLSGGHPYFLQLCCHDLYDAYQRGLSEDERRGYVAQEMKQKAALIFLDCWELLGWDQHFTLISLMLLNVVKHRTSFTTQEIKELHNRSDRFLHGLVRRGMLLKQGEAYEFFSPVFCEWLLAHTFCDPNHEDPFWDEELRSQPLVAKMLAAAGPDGREAIRRVNPEISCILRTWFRGEPKENIARILSSLGAALRLVENR